MARRPSQEQPQEPDVEIIQDPVSESELAIAEVSPIEPVSAPVVEPVKSDASPDQEASESKTTFATSFYKQVGIPTCSTCGESYRTDSYGQPMCPVGKQAPECPRLSK